MASLEASMVAELEALKRKLGKKESFGETVDAIAGFLRNRYPTASPAVRKSAYSAVCRVATLLQTRYTAPGFWLAGLGLFEEAKLLVNDPFEQKHLDKCIVRAQEQLHETDTEIPSYNARQTNSRYLFEGHLTVDHEPPPPAWLRAQNLFTALAATQDLTFQPESSRTQEESIHSNDNDRRDVHLGAVQQIISEMQEVAGVTDLDAAIEESLQEIGIGPKKIPPASKEVVANLPVIDVNEEVIARLGNETVCPVCCQNFATGEKIQQLPCNHSFHPACLKPWLDENNSCPICRYELLTDDGEYERWKEREREAEEERKGAANAVRGGEFMYV